MATPVSVVVNRNKYFYLFFVVIIPFIFCLYKCLIRNRFKITPGKIMRHIRFFNRAFEPESDEIALLDDWSIRFVNKGESF